MVAEGRTMIHDLEEARKIQATRTIRLRGDIKRDPFLPKGKRKGLLVVVYFHYWPGKGG